MQNPKIFIGSSQHAIPIAESFMSQLKALLGYKVDVTPWWVDDQGQGKSELTYPLEQSHDHDFAVVFLTKDDLLKKRGKVIEVPRDNCIFEAGLFMGAFGAQRKEQQRCFLLTSLDRNRQLPSDLGGIRHLKIEETSDSASPVTTTTTRNADVKS